MATAELEENAKTLPIDDNLIAGRYRLHDRIGHGRIGDIFAADDADQQPDGDRSRIAVQAVPESVVRNNRLFNQLNAGYTLLRASPHPNIVEYLRFGRHGKSGYLAMELLDGISLLDVLRDTASLPLDEARPIIRAVGDALRHLHENDFVHGNLTTKNVFVTLDLEVRLLDVLPIDPADPMIRGPFARDPFSRCTVKDDVFGLACLTYEMLSGQHPFGHASAAEARSAGVEARRIATLGDTEWAALRRALSFEDAARTATIEEFLRDFGVRESEPLQAADHRLRGSGFIAQPEETPPAAAVASEPAQSETVARPAPAVAPVPRVDDRPRHARAGRKATHPLRLLVLSLLLAGIGAWWYFGQAREQVIDLLGFVDENTRVRITEPLREMPATAEPAASVAPDAGIAVDEPTGAVPAAEDTASGGGAADLGPVPADSAATGTEPADRAVEDAAVTTATSTPDRAQPATVEEDAPGAAPVNEQDPAAGGDEAMTDATEPAPAAEDADAAAAEPELPFPPTVLTVSEGGGAVRIAAGAAAIPGTRMVWWTSGDSARAGEDFITVEQQFDASRSATDASVVHVPLINDSLPEPRESFFVNLGQYDPARGRIDPVVTVQVNIVDDDGF